MMDKQVCAKCGSTLGLVRGGSGALLCAYCRGAKDGDAVSRYRREAWRRQVAENEKNLVACAKAARECGMSYGEYMMHKEAAEND